MKRVMAGPLIHYRPEKRRRHYSLRKRAMLWIACGSAFHLVATFLCMMSTVSRNFDDPPLPPNSPMMLLMTIMTWPLLQQNWFLRWFPGAAGYLPIVLNSFLVGGALGGVGFALIGLALRGRQQ